MKKIIVTTTIYKPTKALMMYTEKRLGVNSCRRQKDSHDDYNKLEKLGLLKYLHPDEQEKNIKKLVNPLVGIVFKEEILDLLKHIMTMQMWLQQLMMIIYPMKVGVKIYMLDKK